MPTKNLVEVTNTVEENYLLEGTMDLYTWEDTLSGEMIGIWKVCDVQRALLTLKLVLSVSLTTRGSNEETHVKHPTAWCPRGQHRMER